MKRPPVKRDEPPARPITFRAAEDLGPFELAQLWCDRTAWPIDERTQYDELSELAVMSALAQVAPAVAANRDPQCDARGRSPRGGSGCARQQPASRLRSLARVGDSQRDLIVGGKPGITARSTMRSPAASLPWG